MRIVLFDGSSQWRRESELRQCDESKQRSWDSLSGYLGVDLWLLSVAVWVTFFFLLLNIWIQILESGVTHVGIGYISSDASCCQFGDGS